MPDPIHLLRHFHNTGIPVPVRAAMLLLLACILPAADPVLLTGPQAEQRMRITAAPGEGVSPRRARFGNPRPRPRPRVPAWPERAGNVRSPKPVRGPPSNSEGRHPAHPPFRTSRAFSRSTPTMPDSQRTIPTRTAATAITRTPTRRCPFGDWLPAAPIPAWPIRFGSEAISTPSTPRPPAARPTTAMRRPPWTACTGGGARRATAPGPATAPRNTNWPISPPTGAWPCSISPPFRTIPRCNP